MAGMRRLAALGFVLVLFTTPLATGAQPTKIARIGVLSGGSAEPSPLLTRSGSHSASSAISRERAF